MHHHNGHEPKSLKGGSSGRRSFERPPSAPIPVPQGRGRASLDSCRVKASQDESPVGSVKKGAGKGEQELGSQAKNEGGDSSQWCEVHNRRRRSIDAGLCRVLYNSIFPH